MTDIVIYSESLQNGESNLNKEIFTAAESSLLIKKNLLEILCIYEQPPSSFYHEDTMFYCLLYFVDKKHPCLAKDVEM